MFALTIRQKTASSAVDLSSQTHQTDVEYEMSVVPPAFYGDLDGVLRSIMAKAYRFIRGFPNTLYFEAVL